MVNINAGDDLHHVHSVGLIVRLRQQPLARRFVMGIAVLNPSSKSTDTNRLCSSARLPRCICVHALLLLFALSPTSRLNNAVPESPQEAERRCCGEGRLAWTPNDE